MRTLSHCQIGFLYCMIHCHIKILIIAALRHSLQHVSLSSGFAPHYHMKLLGHFTIHENLAVHFGHNNTVLNHTAQFENGFSKQKPFIQNNPLQDRWFNSKFLWYFNLWFLTWARTVFSNFYSYETRQWKELCICLLGSWRQMLLLQLNSISLDWEFNHSVFM